MYAAIGYDAAYPDLNLDSLLTDKGPAAVAQLRKTCIQEAVALGLPMDRRASTYITRDVWAMPTWQRRFHENRLGYTALQSPS